MIKFIIALLALSYTGCSQSVNSGNASDAGSDATSPEDMTVIVRHDMLMAHDMTVKPRMDMMGLLDMTPVQDMTVVTMADMTAEDMSVEVPDMTQQSDLGLTSDLTTPDPCSDITCPADQVCTNGSCACTSTSCEPGSLCVNGICVIPPDMTTPIDMTPVDLGVAPDLSTPDMTSQDGSYPYDGGIPASCDYDENCTFSYGRWKQHWVCNWQTLLLGTVSYTHDELLQILNTPSSGSNGLIELAHQLIGAKMNIVKGADPTQIQSTIDAADNLIGDLIIPSVGTGVFTPQQNTESISLASDLADFNLGYSGPPHCQ